MATKTDKLIRVMSNGKNFTAEQLERKTGLLNVSSAVHRLRQQGAPIYTNRRTAKDGSKFHAYRLAV